MVAVGCAFVKALNKCSMVQLSDMRARPYDLGVLSKDAPIVATQHIKLDALCYIFIFHKKIFFYLPDNEAYTAHFAESIDTDLAQGSNVRCVSAWSSTSVPASARDNSVGFEVAVEGPTYLGFVYLTYNLAHVRYVSPARTERHLPIYDIVGARRREVKPHAMQQYTIMWKVIDGWYELI